MKLDFNSEKPIFLQIAEEIEDAIFTGSFKEEEQIPSTTEISVSFKINPATVLKGMNLLVADNIIYKKRGLGMFVCTGAKQTIQKKRRDDFTNKYVDNMLTEAKKLGLSAQDLCDMIERRYDDVKD